MAATKEDAHLLLKLDEVHKPSLAARRFSYSAELAKVVSDGNFFDVYPLESEERFYINEIATYHEILGSFLTRGIVDEELALEWSGAAITWKLVGPVLVQARSVFGVDALWTDFEALAAAQAAQP